MIRPILFNIGPLEIRWYSLFILLGVLIGYLLINSEANRFKVRKDFLYNMLFWTIIVGILGARIYYVLFNLDYFSNNISEIFKVWHGGLAIHGAIIFGGITLAIYCKKYRANTARMLDILVPALLIAQAIGRWGNFFNNEAYGSIVTYQTLLDIRIIPQFIVDNMYINGSYHLPMFYFESLWCVIGFILMLIIRRKKYIKVGQTTAFYLIWYGFARFFIEYFREDSLMLGSVKIAQVVSILMFLVGLITMLILSRKPKLDDLYNRIETAEEVKF